jgi:hypothetical protein
VAKNDRKTIFKFNALKQFAINQCSINPPRAEVTLIQKGLEAPGSPVGGTDF